MTVPPSEDEKKLATQIAELNDKIKSLSDQVQTWQGKATDLEKKYQGVDPDKAKADKEALEQLMREKGKTDPEAQKQFEERLRQEWGGKVEGLQTQLGAKDKEIRELRVTNTMIEKTKHFNKGSDRLLRDTFDRFCRWEDGKLVIKDDKGAARYSKPNQPMTADEYVEELGGQFPYLLQSEVKKGDMPPGSQVNGSGNGNGLNFDKFKQLPAAEQAKIAPKDRLALATAKLQS